MSMGLIWQVSFQHDQHIEKEGKDREGRVVLVDEVGDK